MDAAGLNSYLGGEIRSNACPSGIFVQTFLAADDVSRGYTSRLLDRIIDQVKAFTGDTPQGDDQTIVVLEVKS